MQKGGESMAQRFFFLFVLFTLFFPFPAHSFTASDLAGTWYGHQVVTGDAPADDTRWGYGVVTIDGAGNYNGTWTDPNQANAVLSGTIQIQSNGTLTLDNQFLTHGVINDGKNLIVLTDGTPAADGNALTILIRRGVGTSFTTSDLAGTWYGNEIVSGDAPGEEPQWGYGTVIIDSSGSFSGTWTSPGETEGINGSVAVNTSGMITINGQPSTHGVMNDDKNLIVLIDGPPSISGSALNILVRRSPALTFSAADLAGSWYGHHVVSGDVNAGDDPRWGYGTAEINNTGQYTVNWISPTQAAGEISSGTLQLTDRGILTIDNQPLTHGILNDASDMFVFIDATLESKGNALAVFIKRAPPPLAGSLHLLFNSMLSQ